LFDNPIFWIVAIWWLLTTLLGSKARRKRRARATPPEPRMSPLPGPAHEREEPVYVGEVKPDEEEMEQEPALPPPPVRPIVKPAISLEQLWRGLGIEPEVVQFRGLADQEEEVIGVAPPIPEPAPVAVAPPQPTKVPERVIHEPSAPPTAHRRHGLTISQAVAGLTPLQQAVVLKEILDRPRALRRGIR